MLSAKHLKGLRMRATDDDIGKIADVLFDDETWTVRYVVVETGSWLSRHPVLISPIALRSIDALEVPIQADLTADEIRNSPHIDLDSPVSRRQERHYHQHYGWPYYWWGGGLWGMYPYPTDLRFRRSSDPSIDPATDLPHDPPTDAGAHGSDAGDPHLRSAHEVIGYDIEATDHGVGTVEDLLIDGRLWRSVTRWSTRASGGSDARFSSLRTGSMRSVGGTWPSGWHSRAMRSRPHQGGSRRRPPSGATRRSCSPTTARIPIGARPPMPVAPFLGGVEANSQPRGLPRPDTQP